MTKPLAGKLVLPDGQNIEWSLTPGSDTVHWADGTRALRLLGRVDVPQVEAALIGWHQGEVEGLYRGRRRVKEEFRKLMGCK